MFNNNSNNIDKLIQMIDLVDQKANLNNAEIETLKEVLTGTLNHIKTLDEKISSMESIINSLQDVIDTLTNMLQND